MIDRSQYRDLDYFIKEFQTQIRDRFNLECEMDFYKLHNSGQQNETMEKKTYTGRRY